MLLYVPEGHACRRSDCTKKPASTGMNPAHPSRHWEGSLAESDRYVPDLHRSTSAAVYGNDAATIATGINNRRIFSGSRALKRESVTGNDCGRL